MSVKDERPSAGRHYRGEVAEHYDDARVRDPLWEQEQHIVEEYISKLPPGSSILDVPVGTGRFFEAYRRANLHVCGVDISDDMLRIAKSKIEDSDKRFVLQVGDATNLNFEPNSFDYIICTRLLNLVPLSDVARILGEMGRVGLRGILVEIRLRENKWLIRFLSAIVKRPIATCRLLIARFIRVPRDVNRRAVGCGAPVFLHETSEFHQLLSEHSLFALSRTIVNESKYSLGYIKQPLYLYSLSPLGCSEDSEKRIHHE